MSSAAKLYTFDELSDSAKENARSWWRELEAGDWEPEMESYETAAKILGIEDVKIAYSGFSSQGDGASFTGSYSHSPSCSQKIRAEFGRDEKLWAIADGLQALQVAYRLSSTHWLEARITRKDARYCHKYTMQVEVTDSETGDNDAFDIAIDGKILDLMRYFAEWIYQSLEADYDYTMSDECVDENILTNDYTFTRDGRRKCFQYARPTRQPALCAAQS